MKRVKPSDADMSRRAEISAARQRHYDAVASSEASAPEHVSADLYVGKGPRGKFYVKRGKEIMSGPYETEAEAKARIG